MTITELVEQERELIEICAKRVIELGETTSDGRKLVKIKEEYREPKIYSLDMMIQAIKDKAEEKCAVLEEYGYYDYSSEVTRRQIINARDYFVSCVSKK